VNTLKHGNSSYLTYNLDQGYIYEPMLVKGVLVTCTDVTFLTKVTWLIFSIWVYKEVTKLHEKLHTRIYTRIKKYNNFSFLLINNRSLGSYARKIYIYIARNNKKIFLCIYNVYMHKISCNFVTFLAFYMEKIGKIFDVTFVKKVTSVHVTSTVFLIATALNIQQDKINQVTSVPLTIIGFLVVKCDLLRSCLIFRSCEVHCDVLNDGMRDLPKNKM